MAHQFRVYFFRVTSDMTVIGALAQAECSVGFVRPTEPHIWVKVSGRSSTSSRFANMHPPRRSTSRQVGEPAVSGASYSPCPNLQCLRFQLFSCRFLRITSGFSRDW
jgi:hypothetical protein